MKPYSFFTIIICLLFCSNGYSQSLEDTLSPAYRAQQLTNQMTCELGLYQEQLDAIKAINLEAFQKLDQVVRTDGSNAKKLDKDQGKIDIQRDKQLRKALTPKQWARYERISNGDQHSLKITQACRKRPDDYSGGF